MISLLIQPFKKKSEIKKTDKSKKKWQNINKILKISIENLKVYEQSQGKTSWLM